MQAFCAYFNLIQVIIHPFEWLDFNWHLQPEGKNLLGYVELLLVNMAYDALMYSINMGELKLE